MRRELEEAKAIADAYERGRQDERERIYSLIAAKAEMAGNRRDALAIRSVAVMIASELT